ncbi:phage/plasmid primase, P4 family [Methylomicrobium sp. RS1]|jgi:P4 family phage/plasmid primase-like protien|uniref:phage/plasmid primase, P4 family n=1 Tax=Candidatus Methylomicrobium oryzae TaxID=2802053 RepID=UPI001920BA29|nr:phage/plasmid primase, P4 family [Methylomicrobium sp. RS1]MBL1263630.1 bifunctional DNA primase/polymerase [Methylomicrobium sp. RS1]
MNNTISTLCSAGLCLVPIPSRDGNPTKGPGKGWNQPRSEVNKNGYSNNPADFVECEGYNFGLYHGASGTLALDIDDLEQTRALFSDVAGVDLAEWLSDPYRFEIQSPKANKGKLIFRLPDGFVSEGAKKLVLANQTIFELRTGNGCQDVIIGHHPEGGAYQLIGDPAAIPEAPPVLLEMLRHWDDWKVCFQPVPESALDRSEPLPRQLQPYESFASSRDPIAEFNQAYTLSDILTRNGYTPYGKDRYLRPGSASGAPGVVVLRQCKDGRERVYSHGGDVLSDGKPHDPFDCFRLLECGGDQNKALNWSSDITQHNRRLFHCQNRLANSEQARFSPPALPGTDARDGTPHSRPLTEHGNALRLSDAHEGRIYYVYDAKAWLYWHDAAWHWDIDGAAIRRLAGTLPEQIYQEGGLYLADAELYAKWARTSQQEKTINAAVSLLKDFNPFRITLACIDADEFLVGLDQGRQVLDLRTGTARAALPGDFVTKSLQVDSIGESTKAERWLAFLDQIFEGDTELIDWFKRWCGYLMTGSTCEQILLFLYGLGANGKSVLADTLRFIMGDYARAIPTETLTESKRQAGAASPDLADLIGARLALSSETEDGAALAESLIKSLTAGDTISVRKLYTSPVQFTPQFKLMILGNHKPIIKGNDVGIWRRLRLIPFRRIFKDKERDPNLLEKLKAEASHILAWMVEGCLEWQQHGLAEVPAVIRNATADYQEEQDLIGRWLAECCRESDQAETSAQELYRSYQQWCIDNGLRAGANISLGRRLGERGFQQRKSRGRSIWLGLGIDLTADLHDCSTVLSQAREDGED